MLDGVSLSLDSSGFVCVLGPELFIPWAENCKAEKLAQCTDEDRALAESFIADGEGEDYEVLSRFLDQYWFNAPLIRTAENQVKAGGKTYVYYFRVESSVPLMKSGHAIELSELNYTLLAPALHVIMGDMRVGETDVQWLMSVYALVEAVVIPLNAFFLGRFTTRRRCSTRSCRSAPRSARPLS